MNLRRLDLQGFKSFADRTQIHFHDGVTAIVGPNGSGKSNISDAIRWVLGEQRASAIRSSKMEEAIFQGTAERRRVNRAEVGLVFSNHDRLLDVPYDDVDIRRVVFREGGSDYQLNRDSVRLKDILDVCRDTGLGANAYAVIEQRMVDAILSDRAEERRHLFEEAAGIGRYKDRRKAARRRLESAEADLERLEDVIGEVRSKVRSLARQKGRAQKHAELREQRLAIEVSLASAELSGLETNLEAVRGRLRELEGGTPGDDGELAVAEADLERRKLEAGELTRERSEVAVELERTNRSISERERELAVAGERQTHAERRLSQIGTERAELEERRRALQKAIGDLELELEQRMRERDAAQREVEQAHTRQQTLREELAKARAEEAAVRERDDVLEEKLARVRARLAEAQARVRDDEERLERLATNRDELGEELAALDQQGDLFEESRKQLAATLEELRREREAELSGLAELREAEAKLRRELADAEDEAHRLASRVSVLETEEREFQGFAPPVARALAARERLEGLAGPVSELVELPEGSDAAFEAAMGSLLQILVAEDSESAEAMSSDLARTIGDDGVVAILPRGGLEQVRALLDAVSFVGEPAKEPLLVGRRERLADFRARAEAATARKEELGTARSEAAEQLAEAEERLARLEEKLRAAESELHQAESEHDARSGRRERTFRQREELGERREATASSLREAGLLVEESMAERDAAEAELEQNRAARLEAARTRAEREARWEAARDEEAESRVTAARTEGALESTERRLADTREALRAADQRLVSLREEKDEHQATLEQVDEVREKAGGELDRLFEQREHLSADLHTRERRLTEANSAMEELERTVRALRRDASARSEERHRLELEQAEAVAKRRSITERLEAEWGRPFQQLVEAVEILEGDANALRAQLGALTADIERLGPINMLAVDEHREENDRLEFLTSQKDDLLAARDDLESAIRRINRAARERFERTFTEVRENFGRTFDALFQGGQCDVWLADPDDPLESPIEISASPRGKRTQRINLLSGGERALTSLALLFAIYLVKPSPFCVLDEVDAPLDESNIARFVAMLEQFKKDTQFVVITHNPRTMEAADYIYGVTMEEPGVSKIVGVQLDQGGNGTADAPGVEAALSGAEAG